MSLLRRTSSLLTLALLALFALSACGGGATNTQGNSGKIEIVAAENFYGSIAQQVGGDRVNVTSILTNSEVDPHEYSSNFNNSKAVNNARIVILNGAGYDEWMTQLLQSSNKQDRIVINAFELAKTKLGENEHVWYGINNAEAVAHTVADNLKKIDSAHATTYDNNFATFNTELNKVRQKMADIKSKYNGTPIGVTESIFMFQAEPTGLKVLTPEELQEAIAEDTDPPAAAIATAETQIKNKAIKVLIYNAQTVTPLTTRLQDEAKKQNIPTTAVTETMPTNKTYQSWMLDQLTSLEQALASTK